MRAIPTPTRRTGASGGFTVAAGADSRFGCSPPGSCGSVQQRAREWQNETEIERERETHIRTLGSEYKRWMSLRCVCFGRTVAGVAVWQWAGRRRDVDALMWRTNHIYIYKYIHTNTHKITHTHRDRNGQEELAKKEQQYKLPTIYSLSLKYIHIYMYVYTLPI